MRLDIPFEKATLANGLRVIAHQDSKAPIVTVSVWYHVGSKNERPGRTGLAHLFEHLMFEGSAHHDKEHFEPLENAGASAINGTTSRDRTNFFETLPAASLDLALWLESDRMGHLLGVMTQEKLDEQREVVRNEKKQSDNQPYGRVGELLSRSLYPEAHPYSWPIIGRIADLDATSLDDVEEWFRTWYAPTNAVVVVSGDVEPQAAIDRVEAHFGSIAPGVGLERPGRWVSPLPGPRRVSLEDRVPQGRVYRCWNVPPSYDTDHQHLSLLARVLSHGKSSRLYKRLVYDDQIATDASAYLWSGEIGSSFVVQATAVPGGDPEAVESALDEELSRVLTEGPDEEELERARSRTLSAFVHGVERSGGFGGKSEVLAHGEVFRGDPAAFQESIATIETARTRDLHAAGRTWLGGRHLTLVVTPMPQRASSASDVDRSSLPSAPEIISADLPFPQTRRLANGLEVIAWRRANLPLVYSRLLVDAGFAADLGSTRGTATLTMAAIDEGTASLSALDISDRLAGLGARLVCGTGLDECRISVASLSDGADAATDLLAEIVLEPSFPEAEIERLKREQIARIGREMVAPVRLALRVLPLLLYGERHPYGMPFTGSGTTDEVASIDRRQVTDFHQRWLRPERSTLLCLGDVDVERVVERAELLFGTWEASREAVPSPETVLPERPAEPRILLLHRPDSIQSIIFGGQLVPPRNDPDELALEMFHEALGGTFTSRLNMNLREDKGWTYGAHSLLWSARRERPFLLYSSVQADATADSIREMDREVREMLDGRPIDDGELERVRRQLVLSLPARREALADTADDLEEILGNDLPRDHYVGYSERVAALTPPDVTAAARRCIAPESFVWVVVGDLGTIRSDVERLGWGEPTEIDDRGNPV